jgi:pimeloyl-ACP methyl ester carboxylesterase
MLASRIDSALARLAAWRRTDTIGGALPTQRIDTPAGTVRVYDSGALDSHTLESAIAKPCVVFVPDGPNVIEHYEELIGLLSTQVSQQLRVVCFDMPGFGFSFPPSGYQHSLDHGARAVLVCGIICALRRRRLHLVVRMVFMRCALRVAQLAPARVSNLVLSQTPSLAAMHAWTRRVIPWPIRVPVVGQIIAWLSRKKAAHGWYKIALPRKTSPSLFQQKAGDALSGGACFCLAGVVQCLARESIDSLRGVTTPCTMIWGTLDHSHKHTDPLSLHALVPHAEIVRFEDCGHFPDIEQAARYAGILVARVVK